MEITDKLFAVVSIAAFVICIMFVFVESKRDPFSRATAMSVGAAGFSVFPIINIVVAVAILLYWNGIVKDGQ